MKQNQNVDFLASDQISQALLVSFQFTYSNILNYKHKQVPYLFHCIVIHSNDISKFCMLCF